MQKYTLLPTSDDQSIWSDQYSTSSTDSIINKPNLVNRTGDSLGTNGRDSHGTVQMGLNAVYLNTPTSTTVRQIGFNERFKLVASALVHSKYYFTLYFLVVILCLVSLIWALVEPDQQVIGVILLEVIINLILMAELGLRFASLGAKRYLASWSNWFDLFVLLLCLITLIINALSTSGESSGEEVEEIASLILLIFRSVLQIGRLVVLFKNQMSQSTHRQVDIMRIEKPRTDSMSNMLTNDDDDNEANYLIDDEEN